MTVGKTKTLITAPLTFGCDPEFFFERAGEVIGSEKVIPKPLAGLTTYGTYGDAKHAPLKPAFVQDGVQVELNPTPNTCRANLGNEIAASFRALRNHLANMQGVTASFRSVVEVSPEEMASLGEKAKALGCAPSINAYDHHATVNVDGSTYRKRAAGGHIHLGLYDLKAHRERLVPLMDVLVGNTSVLIDRDPHAAERRLHYGRAGEYRLPEHGLEYRTLSNYWLRSYQLFSLVMGLSRLAASVLYTEMASPAMFGALVWPAATELLANSDLEKVAHAINTNDPVLAAENFKPVRKFIEDHNVFSGSFGLENGSLRTFDYFVHVVEQKGIEAWFPQDPLSHWCSKPEGHGTGWETFLTNTVAPQVPLGFS